MKLQGAKLAKHFRITEGRKFRLKNIDPGDTRGLQKEQAEELLAQGSQRLAELQELLYAQDRWAVLIIFQAMDAAGKDGTIKHVFSGVNPQGCHVSAFKAPSSEELDHDFLWRSTRALPERGRIGVFNRSYYEEVLVVRVHPECIERQKLPERLVTKRLWDERFEDIGAYERYLSRNGIAVRKFFLHVSREEQKKRICERLDNEEKNWKFAIEDVRERVRWDDYQTAYEEAIARTASEDAPWFVIPADHKWFTRLVVMNAVIETLESLKLELPQLNADQKKALAVARQELEAQK